MAGVRQSGLGMQFFLDGWDLSGDVNALSAIRGGPAAIDMTAINDFAYERQGGLRAGAIDFNTHWDSGGPAFNLQEHGALAPLPYTDRVAMAVVGSTIGAPAAACLAKQLNHDWTRDNNGGLNGTVNTQSNGFGLEWGNMLTPGIRADTTATAAGAGNSFDTGASAAFGGQAYLEAFGSAGGIACTVSVWDSADNITFAAVPGLAFAAFTTAGSQRAAISNTATIRRYVAVASAGAFTGVNFAVMLHKNEVAGVTF